MPVWTRSGFVFFAAWPLGACAGRQSALDPHALQSGDIFRTFTASISRSTAPNCISAPAKRDWRASSPRSRNSPYLGGRGAYWVKTTCAHRETLATAGFALDGSKWDGIFLGRRKGADLIDAGKVDHGFDKAAETELRKRLKPLIRKTQPYAKRIAHKGIWVEPKLLAEVEYRGKSAEGKVRHPFYKGLREDL